MYRLLIGGLVVKFSAVCVVAAMFDQYLIALLSGISLGIVFGIIIGYYIAIRKNSFTTFLKQKAGLIND